MCLVSQHLSPSVPLLPRSQEDALQMDPAQTSVDTLRCREGSGVSHHLPPTKHSHTHTHTRGRIMSAPSSPTDLSPLKEAGCQMLSGLGVQKCLGRSGVISPHVVFNTSLPDWRRQPSITAWLKSDRCRSFLVKVYARRGNYFPL